MLVKAVFWMFTADGWVLVNLAMPLDQLLPESTTMLSVTVLVSPNNKRQHHLSPSPAFGTGAYINIALYSLKGEKPCTYVTFRR
jgi:hypothetical protein